MNLGTRNLGLLVFAFALNLTILPAHAADSVAPVSTSSSSDEDFAILAGLGFGMDVGIFGLQSRILLNDNFFALGGIGIDLRGGVWGAGLGYQTDLRDGTCLFFIDCHKRYRLSVAYMSYSGNTLTAGGTESETECENGFCFSASGSSGAEYKASKSRAVNVGFAWQDMFGKHFFYELELGYLAMIEPVNLTYKSGLATATDESDLDQVVGSNISLGIKTGFYF